MCTVDIIHRGRPRAVRVPVEYIAVVAALQERVGPRQAAQELGLGRAALLGVVATGKALPGTVALLREALARRGIT
jgi:hypothetical protein